MWFATLAMAHPTAPAQFPDVNAVALDGRSLKLEAGSYTIVDSIRSAEW